MNLDVSKRRKIYRLVGRYGTTRLRLSLGTGNGAWAEKVKNQIHICLLGGPNCEGWGDLQKKLPRSAFEKLAALAGYESRPGKKDPTWEELLKLYDANCAQRIARNDMRASSKLRFDFSLREFSRFLSEQGIEKLRDIKPAVIEEWKAWHTKRTANTKQATNGVGLIGDVGAVHRVFQFGMGLEYDWVMKNPVKTVRRKKGAPNPYDNQELENMFKVAGEHRFTLLVLLHTGLRANDAAHLQWKHINFKERFIEIITQKRSKSASIPLSPQLHFELESERDRRQALPDETVLLNCQGRAMSSGKYLQSTVVRLIGQAAGVKKPKAHRFRHTFVSRMMANGATYADVGKMIGDSAETVETFYAGLSPAWKERLRKHVEVASEKVPPELVGTNRAQSLPTRRPIQ